MSEPRATKPVRAIPPPARGPIAVVGVSALFPGSAEAGGFWRDILAGRDLITDVPASHWLIEDFYDPDPKAPDKTYARRGSFLSPIDFDAMAYGIPPAIAPATDSAQLLALIVAKQVLDDAAGGQFDRLDKSRISVILGVTSAQELLATMVGRLQRPVWVKALRESGFDEPRVEEICERIASHYIPWQESTFPGLLGNVVAGRIANRFDLGGTNCVTDAACASAFASVSMAANELHLGDSDMVIAGGVDTLNDIFMYMCFSKTPALSPTGDCRPFSDQADGTLLGEGLGMVALKRLADAERDGDTIYAVLKGLGSSSDGRAKSVYAPRAAGQARALAQAYDRAGYSPATVELIEAHGTGTKAGDAAEFEGLRLAFEDSGRDDRQWCALGSVKSQIGHTKAAAGAAGLFKIVMALHHKVLPPTIKVERPNPELALESSPFYLNTRARPWIRDDEHPRRASVSSFGFGGSNFHLALEEYRGPGKPPRRWRESPAELVILTAGSAAELAEKCAATAAGADRPGSLAWLAASTQRSLDAAAPHRLAVVAGADDLPAKLLQAAERLRDRPEEPFATPGGLYYGCGEASPRVAFLFPGQGSQYVGMGADLAMSFERARAVWDRAASLPLGGGVRLHQVVFPRPVFSDDERQEQSAWLTGTEWAQPAIGAVSLSQLALLEDLGIRAECVGGHSYGEITALCAAGVLDGESMLRVARRRGELMREASAVLGAMTAVACSVERLEPLLETWGSAVTVANHNAPEQVVLSGTAVAIDEVERRLAEREIQARRVPVSAAFHSPLMSDSCGPFFDFLDSIELKAPAVDVYSGADAAPYAAESAAIRRQLADQIAQPVRFVSQIEAMVEHGLDTFIEVGPGSVLATLVDQCLEGRPHLAVSLDRKGRDGLTSLWHALGQLAAAGLPMDFEPLWRGFSAPADPSAVDKPKMALSITGSNYGKLYPPPGGAAALPPPNPPRPEIPQVPTHRVAPPAAEPRHEATPRPEEKASAMSTDAKNPDSQLAWIHAYQEAQRQTVDAHAAFQRSMAETQASFLETMQASFAGLSGLVTGSTDATAALPETASSGLLAPPEAAALAGLRDEAPPPAAFIAAPVPPPRQPTAEPAAEPAAEPVAAFVAPSMPPAAPQAADEAPLTTASQADLQALMLDVVADKTGYPVEMLTLEMDMEADLGIDSIKRVEILSAMRESEPRLPEVDTAQMAQLRTLGQIVEHMQSTAPALSPPPSLPETPGTSAPAPETTAAETPVPAASGSDTEGPGAAELQALMLDVVADKTGYPVEMLSLEMDMEADLGIDSIKRVEILSAMRESEPRLPEVDTAQMAQLRTLGQIVEHMGGDADAGSAESAAPAPSPAAGDAASSHAAPEIGRFALRQVDAPAAGLAMAGLAAGGRVVVTVDGTGVAAALAERLIRRGLAAEVAQEVPADAAAVVFLGGLIPVADLAESRDVNRQAFRAARAVAAPFTAAGRGVFVTVQDTGGDFGLSGSDPVRAALGGLAGLVKTAAREWPGAALKAIDLEQGGRTPDALAEAIVQELFDGGPELEVGLHADGRRTTLESFEAPLSGDRAPVIHGQSVLLASGGARGVTAATLIALAREAGPRMVLLGRTPLADEPETCRGIEDEAGLKRALLALATAAGESLTPKELGQRAGRIRAGREIRATLAALRDAGSEARYVTADVRDAATLASVLEAVRGDWGPITGIVHGAGVIADKAIAEKTQEQFDRVFDTKVDGLRRLLEATAADPLEVLCLFSSVTARCGNVGQSDYAMANEVLNKIAAAERARRGGACRVKSLNWGPWEGGMVTPELETHFAAMGVALIPLAVGARMMADELQTAGAAADQVEVVLGGAPSFGPWIDGDTVAMDAFVSRETHPFLDSHVIGGTAVFPVVLALEWFHRLARAHRPDLEVVACRDLKVLRGIRLEGFGDGAQGFCLRSRQLTNGSGCELALELRDRDGHPRYSALVDMVTPGDRPQPAAVAEPRLGPWPDAPIYGGALFHGPQLQVIREIEGFSGESIAGRLAGAADLGWGAGWRLDAAVLDGALQLAVLWFEQALEGASLPLAVGAVRTWFDGPLTGPIRAIARCRARDANRVVAGIALIDGDGRVLAQLEGVEIIRRPDGTASHAEAESHAEA